MNKYQEPEHVSLGSVLDDLGFSPEKAALLKLKAQLHQKIVEHVARAQYTQMQVQSILGTSQPRVSDLMAGKLSKFSLDMLVTYAGQLGIRTELKAELVAV